MLNQQTNIREFPRGNVAQGFYPQNSAEVGLTYPVLVAADGSRDNILQGMVCTIAADGKHLVMGVPAGAKTSQYFFALQDAASLEASAGELLVVPFSSPNKIFLPFFAQNLCQEDGTVVDAAYMYTTGTEVTPCKATEFHKVTRVVNGVDTELIESLVGSVRPAKTGEPVVGVVPQHFTGKNGAGSATDVTLCNAKPLMRSYAMAEDTTANPENAYFIFVNTQVTTTKA